MKMKNKITIVIFIIISISIVSIIYFINGRIGDDQYNMEIHFFDAGKADCVLISCNNRYIMIDTGEESLSSEILSYLKNNNITKLDYLIITHFDKDHVGSASKILDSIQVDNVLQSNFPKESTYYSNYINSLASKKIIAQTISGDVYFTLDDLSITANGPEIVYDSDESNNSSLIISIKYKNTSFLFTGDCQNARIKDYINTHKEEYDFIKIPYHGNYQKRLEDLLEVVNPKYAVITCSKSEPDISDTEELLNKLNIIYYLTRNGSIHIKSDGQNINIKQ